MDTFFKEVEEREIGRIVYDAFVLDNKKAGIYYHPIA